MSFVSNNSTIIGNVTLKSNINVINNTLISGSASINLLKTDSSREDKKL
jgi:carbonic anhydrase/acetyltransferase-like protein (isoleucine patch superfamily)